MVSVGEGIVYVTPAKLKRAASFTIVRRKAEFELLCVPRQSDAPRQCSHRKSCTAAASAMTKGNFGPFMTTGLPSTRAVSGRSLHNAPMAVMWASRHFRHTVLYAKKFDKGSWTRLENPEKARTPLTNHATVRGVAKES
jgi:hypothetical protein